MKVDKLNGLICTYVKCGMYISYKNTHGSI